MKLSWALGPRRALSRQTAWGCFTSNVFTPGFGSLAAGRSSGYPQAVLGILSVILTSIFGVRFILWYLANLTRMHGTPDDPFGALAELWEAFRWVLPGFLLFAIAWLWALGTSLSILREAKAAERSLVPPRLS